MARDPNEKVSLTLRLPERVRKDVEDRANYRKTSLNLEIVHELESYGRQQDEISARFGTREIATFMQALSSCAVLAQIQTGKPFHSDADTMNRALIAMRAILLNFRPSDKMAGSRDAEPSDVAINAGLEIARFSADSIFHGLTVEEPAWLQAYTEAMKNERASQEPKE
ncbi:hypothetical protein [Methylobacterium sp. A54F]